MNERVEFTNTKLSVGRSLTSYAKVQRAISAVIRNRRYFISPKSKGLLLDVGCGPNARAENINLDYYWHPGIDICCDITRGIPLPDNYVRGIFTEHCLEHLTFEAVLSVLFEFRRVLQPNGVVRIVVPDLEIYIDGYRERRPLPYASDDYAMGVYTPAMSVNRIFFDHGHRFIYDFDTLKTLLDKAAFSNIQKRAFGEGDDQKLLLDNQERSIESLYVEATAISTRG